jgi:hypothetical protein
MIKAMIILAVLSVFLIGCTITGKVIQPVEDSSFQIENDTEILVDAVNNDDPSLCYYISTRMIKDDCFSRFVSG